MEVGNVYDVEFSAGRYEIEYEECVKCIKITPKSYRVERRDGTTRLIGHDSILGLTKLNQGLEATKSAGIRKNISQAPIPKSKPKKGAQWIGAQLKDSGLRPLKGFGNGITKVALECSKGHVFKLDGRTLVRFPFCPVCEPERFDAYTLRRVEYL